MALPINPNRATQAKPRGREEAAHQLEIDWHTPRFFIFQKQNRQLFESKRVNEKTLILFERHK